MTIRYAASGRALFRAATFALVLPALAAAQQRPNGLLVGRVLSGDVAVPSAAIFVSGGRVTLARVDGRFRMSLPAGRYEVRAQRIGYTTGRDSVTIVAGDSSVVQIRVERSPVAFDAVAAVGTRGYERSAIDALAPVEVIDGAQLRATGRTGTSEALQAFSASINVPHNGTGDATDLVHPFTMRGLGADEVLVLVNGKRRHQSALLNTNTTLGRGTSGTDLDAIPLSMVDHVEILHGDGTAQYGSGAVAGVVNVVLKSGVHGFATATAGGDLTTYNRADASPETYYDPASHAASDGRTAQAAIDKGVVFGERGFLHGGLEVRDRGATNRALGVNLSGVYTDIKERYGDPSTHDVSLFLNGGNLLHNGVEVYGNLGGTRRRTDASALYYSFAPMATVRGTLDDYAGTFGLRGMLDDWRWELSNVLGRSHVGLALTPAYDRFNGDTVPHLDAGAQALTQNTTTLELFRTLPWMEETRLTIGGELRHDGYTVSAGEPRSNLPVVGLGSPAPYWWGLPAFTPAQAGSHTRTVTGGYVDAEVDANSITTIGLAGRAEHAGSFGTQLAGKLSARLEPVRKLVLRGSVARGFRAPSLQQETLNGYAPYFGNALPLLPPDNPNVAALFSPLRTERSTEIAAGVATELTPAISFTTDLYRTDLKDRLIVTDIGQGGIGFDNVTNGPDTRTEGIDATLSYGRSIGASTLRLSGGANLSRHALLRADNSTYLGYSIAKQSFTALTQLVHGQPTSNLFGVANFMAGPVGAMLRVQSVGGAREGANVSNPPSGGVCCFSQPTEAVIPRETVVDASASLTMLRKYTLSVGADNLLDQYPQRSALGRWVYSIPPALPYLTQSPLGFNGRYVYGKLSIYL